MNIEVLTAENNALKLQVKNFSIENKNFRVESDNFKIEQANFKRQLEEYQQAYEQIKHQLQELLRHRFGKKSERFIDPENPQLDLFAEEQVIMDLPQEGETTKVEAHQRKKKKKDTSQYPRVIEVIPVPEEDKVCGCGAQKQVIRYETKELFDYQPAVFRVIEQRREVVACAKGCEQSIQTAPAPKHVLPKVKATEAKPLHDLEGALLTLQSGTDMFSVYYRKLWWHVCRFYKAPYRNTPKKDLPREQQTHAKMNIV